MGPSRLTQHSLLSSAVLQPTENGVSESSSPDRVSEDSEKNTVGMEGKRVGRKKREGEDR